LVKLTAARINQLASRKGVKKIAVENFLSTMGSRDDALVNLGEDARSYGWNAATQRAIRTGILETTGRF
jgi:hypothetical protein